MPSEEKKDDKGFAGLSALVSDVESAISTAASSSQQESRETAPSAASTNSPDDSQINRAPYQHSKPASGGGNSAGKWVVGLAVIIGVFWLIFSGSQNPGGSSAGSTSPQASGYVLNPNASPSTQTSGVVLTPDASAPAGNLPQSAPATPPFEETPPPGTGNVLSVAQIRYCLSEDIRLEAAKGVIDHTIDSDVNRFNAMVADYNSRCGQYRYRRGTLESARSEVEVKRSQLEAEGRGRFPGQSSAAAGFAPTANAPVIADLNKPSSNDAVATQAQQQESANSGRNLNNLRTCLEGRYPSLCDHSLLTNDEAARVRLAEKRANLATCLDGRYPSLCDHSLLTADEVVRVGRAERRVNLATCLNGRYPSLCDHSLLSMNEAKRVADAESAANFNTCISGRYATLCNHSLLTPEEAERVAEAERQNGN